MDQVTVAKSIEQQMRDAVVAERLQKHLDVFSRFSATAGSEDEWTAARYIVDADARVRD